MKKENKKMAQERRARERRKKEIQKKISKAIVILIPLIAVIVLFIAIAVTSADSASETDADTDTAAGYSTDASLTVENGDTVNIDYVGTVDGTEFDGGSTGGMGTDLTIGSGLYIDDFEDQLVGSHPGDEVEVTVTFPEDYGKEDLNGKEAVFDVTVNGIYK